MSVFMCMLHARTWLGKSYKHTLTLHVKELSYQIKSAASEHLILISTDKPSSVNCPETTALASQNIH